QTPPSSSVPTKTLVITEGPTTVRGENSAHTANEEPPSHTKGKKADMDTDEPTGPVIYITSPSQPESSQVIQRTDKGKGITIDDNEEPIRKRVHASREIHQDLDEPIRVPYEIYGKMYQLRNDEIQAHLDKEEKIVKVVEVAKLLAMSKLELIKVAHEEALNLGIHPKVLASEKGGYEFKRIQDSKGNDRINFNVHNPFKFADFGVNELDELGSIIEKKKNKIIGELMISLGKRYERLKKISEDLGIQLALPPPAPEQGSSQL
ncbi:hypothetical protein Tco_1096187, partial [Tanacetum coccineum]